MSLLDSLELDMIVINVVINGQQYITHNKFICTSMPSFNTEPIAHNSGSIMLPPRSVSIISIKAPTKLNARHLYRLDAADNVPPSIIPLAVDHKMDHQYPKWLHILLLNTEFNTVQISRKTVIGKLYPIVITGSAVNNISWTTDSTTTKNKSAKLLCMPPKSSFQPEHNISRHSILLEDAHITQEDKDGLASLLEGEYSSSIYKSPTDVGRTNFFQMDIQTAWLPIAQKPYPILLKYQ